MDTFWAWVTVSPLATAAKTFIAVVLSAAVADWATGGVISLANWQTWVISAAVSAIPVIVNWLNPMDSRYGRGEMSIDFEGEEL